MCAGIRIDELSGDADLVGMALDAALKNVADPEVLPYLPDIDGLAFVNHGRVAGDDEDALESSEVGDDVFGKAVGQTVRRVVITNVVQRENGY